MAKHTKKTKPMDKKKLLPIALIVGGIAAGAIALLGTSKPAAPPSGGGTLPTNTNGNQSDFWANFSTNLSALLSTITGGIATVSSVIKAKGNIESMDSVTVNGLKLTGLMATDKVKHLKKGDRITIVPSPSSHPSFAGTFTVVQMGDEDGYFKDNLIVIQKPYMLANISGTFTEV